MGSIFVLTGRSVTEESAERAFFCTLSRGPDLSHFFATEGGYVGYHRLAIVGRSAAGMQPFFRGKRFCVCDGELYNFRALREALRGEGFSFRSDCDCEVLLPLYEKYGVRLFERLDGDFACVLYDGERGMYVAARDPVGVRPLYYGFLPGGEIAFASEPKNLAPLCRGVRPFPPGRYYDGKFHAYRTLVPRAGGVPALQEALVRAVEKRLRADAPLGILLSGGLASSLLAAVAGQSARPLRTFAVGMERGAPDLWYARAVADRIGSVHTEFLVTEREAAECLAPAIAAIGSCEASAVRAAVGEFLLCKKIRASSDLRVLISGEGADELFGDPAGGASSAAGPLFLRERIGSLHGRALLRADRCAFHHSLEPRFPFCDRDLLSCTMGISRGDLPQRGGGRALLRAFGGDLLPPEVLCRERAPFAEGMGLADAGGILSCAGAMYGIGPEKGDENAGEAQLAEEKFYRKILSRVRSGRPA